MTALAEPLRLSIAELDFVARASDLTAFPGLPTDIADPAADRAILDSLRARGIVEGARDELGLRADVAQLLGVILDCDVSLELDVATVADALTTVVHLHDDVAIVQHAVDGLVTLLLMRTSEIPDVLLALCGEDPASGDGRPRAAVRVTRDALLDIEPLEAGAEAQAGDASPLAGYIASAEQPQRAGCAAARGTLYGEPRVACSWLAGPGGTYVIHDRGPEVEIVRADGLLLAEQLLALCEPSA